MVVCIPNKQTDCCECKQTHNPTHSLSRVHALHTPNIIARLLRQQQQQQRENNNNHHRPQRQSTRRLAVPTPSPPPETGQDNLKCSLVCVCVCVLMSVAMELSPCPSSPPSMSISIVVGTQETNKHIHHQHNLVSPVVDMCGIASVLFTSHSMQVNVVCPLHLSIWPDNTEDLVWLLPSCVLLS